MLGEVLESDNAEFKIGEHVVGSFGWQTCAVSGETDVDFQMLAQSNILLTAYPGACGSNGLTAP